MLLIERIFLRLDEPPWNALLRMTVGVAFAAGFEAICQGRCRKESVIILFVVTLMMIRMVPLVFRRLLPFSKDAQRVWASRRRLGRLFDSYQWRKLFWIGLGLGAYTALYRPANAYHGWLAVFCLVAGGAGLWKWNEIAEHHGKPSK
jgi:uncharacterized membrane protein YfcA